MRWTPVLVIPLLVACPGRPAGDGDSGGDATDTSTSAGGTLTTPTDDTISPSC